MAKFEFSGMEEMTAYLKRTKQLTGQMANAMVDAAVPIVIDTWRGVIEKHKHVDRQAMIKSVGLAKQRADVDHVYRDIYPQGKDKKGVRNAEKAFLLHYGWDSNNTKSGKHNGDHFVDEIEAESTDEVVTAMENVMNEWLERG